MTSGAVSKRIKNSFLAYCNYNNIEIGECFESIKKDIVQENDLIDIAKYDMGIQDFNGFRMIKFYENPDVNKKVEEISQAQIIREIINQAENSYNIKKGYRDIFITAATGAGKSLIFQIPAIYLAKKYNKLTIIIEPVKALMQDQKTSLNNNGYMRVETFNSDIITQMEREEVLKRIKNGEVDLLYLSPETLLSYSIETIIWNREIGLLIIDEAHIVTTWGVGFRPDYWYLGSYINKLRNQIKIGSKINRKIHNFPVCAFTATAINGGVDDSVGETIISLYMENPIKFIGYTKRENIEFNIFNKNFNKKFSKSDYDFEKIKDFQNRLKYWLRNKEKTLVYFPFASLASDAKKGIRMFNELGTSNNIGIYVGRNVDDISTKIFNEQKQENFNRFRKGEIIVMYATKAFGMGVDLDDIQNVYHYAVTGSLCDYIQEIGRAARKNIISGHAITDFYYKDLAYIRKLFAISQIRHYQIMKVLEGIYNIHKNKNYARNFLISPKSFTYVFKGDENAKVNKLKTCLLMLEKDFYDKYNFKVLISRPQSVFTKAFVVLYSEHVEKVLNSKYGANFTFVECGRKKEKEKENCLISDVGDIYIIDLKKIWEDFYPKLSFPKFKYLYFNNKNINENKMEIMPEIREYLAPRQKLIIEVCDDSTLGDMRDKILADFEYIANALYENFAKQFFTIEDFTKLLVDKYGKNVARIIANSLFDLVDSNNRCVKHRINSSNRTEYSLAHGNFKEYMRRIITKSSIINKISTLTTSSYLSYISVGNDENITKSLKLLSVFGYITYELWIGYNK